MKKLVALILLASLACFTGCETVKDTLREHQQAIQVQKEVSKLLDRYATPTKEPIRFDS